MSQYDNDTMIHNDGNDHIIDKLISLYHNEGSPHVWFRRDNPAT